LRQPYSIRGPSPEQETREFAQLDRRF
jgi:hypothetical protein